MIPEWFVELSIAPALKLLPKKMDTPQARAMMLAIALQESRLQHRVQVSGPAHGFYQFEITGVRGVLLHHASAGYIGEVLDILNYDATPIDSYHAVEHNDILASCYARLLLYALPEALPQDGQHDEGWRQYIKAWRPGKPHRETWNANFDQAWLLINGGD